MTLPGVTTTPATLPRPEEVRRIAVLQALYLGDFLCTVPALRALRARFPDAEITLIGLAGNRSLALRFPYVDRFLEFPGFDGLEGTRWNPGVTDRFVCEARDHRYDLAIQMHGDGSVSNAFASMLGARASIGYRPANPETPHRLTVEVVDRSDLPQPLKWLRLVNLLGGFGSPHLEFPLLPEDAAELREVAAATGLDLRAPIVAVHPGSKLPDRRWPVEKYAVTADCLAARLGVQIAITGTADEQDLGRGIAESMRAAPIDLVGRTSVGALAALLSRVRLLVTNDTGPSHLAAALGTASVVLFGPSDPAVWGPLDRHLHRPVSAGSGGLVADVPVAAVLSESLSVVKSCCDRRS